MAINSQKKEKGLTDMITTSIKNSVFYFNNYTPKDFTRWGPPAGKKIQKKRKSIEKSYLDVLYGSGNVRNRSSMLELLLLAPKNII